MARITATGPKRRLWAGVAFAMAVAAVTGWMTPAGQSVAATAGNAFGARNSVAAAEAPAFTAEEAEIVESSRRLYEAWGFQFPDASIRFHAGSTENCRGQAGEYREWADGMATIDVCYPDSDPEIGHIMRAFVLWHELGHAYVETQADDATKEAFMDLLGLDSWTGGEWDERAAEYAADILVWGMLNGEYRMLVPDLDCQTKSAGFTILTGRAGPTC